MKRVFRTGEAWGSVRTRVATARRPAPTVSSGAALALCVAGGAAGAYFLDPQNGRRRRQIVFGHVTALLSKRGESLPDPDLANKVRSEIFRDKHVPKGHVNVNAENGVVYLRGQVPSAEDEERLAKQARKIAGVREVVDLLHLPGEPARTKETVAVGR